MKIRTIFNTSDNASAQAVHKAAQNRSHGAKPGAHRYERRKIREYLRHAQFDSNGSTAFAE